MLRPIVFLSENCHYMFPLNRFCAIVSSPCLTFCQTRWISQNPILEILLQDMSRLFIFFSSLHCCFDNQSFWSEIWSQWDQFVEGPERNFTPKFRRSSELRGSSWSKSFRGGIKSYHTKVRKCTNALLNIKNCAEM